MLGSTEEGVTVLQYSADYGAPSLQLAPDRGHYLISVIISPAACSLGKKKVRAVTWSVLQKSGVHFCGKLTIRPERFVLVKNIPPQVDLSLNFRTLVKKNVL